MVPCFAVVTGNVSKACKMDMTTPTVDGRNQEDLR